VRQFFKNKLGDALGKKKPELKSKVTMPLAGLLSNLGGLGGLGGLSGSKDKSAALLGQTSNKVSVMNDISSKSMLKNSSLASISSKVQVKIAGPNQADNESVSVTSVRPDT